MSQERIKELFLRALPLDAGERTALLSSECNPTADAALIEEVRSLLAAHDTSQTFLESSAMADSGLAPTLGSHWAAPGAKVGPFTLESVIGSGGMGIVFRARQDAPPRPVAIKIMRAPGLGGGMLARFSREAAALARLQHPCIAQVYAAGVEMVAGERVPYLAMELVLGEPLDAYVRREAPSTRQRAELLARICDAVAHAHQRGVVHRDLKPANILIEPGGAPKILDFGIARLVEPGDSDPGSRDTSQTQRGEILGTLAYMSPEQFEGDPEKIDVRADVYTLGAILYEVLAGTPAIGTDRLSITQAALAVTTREPALLGTHHPALRGDLETIVAKALEKEPARRYQSAAELTEDLRRHLRDEPILARPSTAFYRASKFVRRHRAVVVLGIGVIAALTAGLAATLWQARQTAMERDRAEAEVGNTNEINDFLAGILQAGDPERARGRTITIRMAVDDAVDRINKGDIKSPRVLASLHGTLGKSYWSMGEAPLAESHMRRAIILRREVHGEHSEQVADAIAGLAGMLNSLGRTQESRDMAGPALTWARAELGNDNPATIALITVYANSLSDPALIEPLALEAIERNTRVHGAESDDTLAAINNLGVLYMESGQHERGLKTLQELLDKRLKRFGEDHPDTVVSFVNIAGVLRMLNRPAEALPYSQKALEVGNRVRGKAHPGQVAAHFEHAIELAMLGRFDEGVATIRESIPLSRTADGRAGEHTGSQLGLLAELLILLNRLDEAQAAVDEGYAAALEFHGPDHSDSRQLKSTYITLYEARKDWRRVREWNDKLKGTPLYLTKYELGPGQDPASPPPAPPPESPASTGESPK